jgi:hypothetical protein
LIKTNITLLDLKITKYRVRTKCRAFQALHLCVSNLYCKRFEF